MKRYIIHADSYGDAVTGLTACEALEREGHEECLYVYGERPNEVVAHVTRNKTGLTVRVLSGASA